MPEVHAAMTPQDQAAPLETAARAGVVTADQSTLVGDGTVEDINALLDEAQSIGTPLTGSPASSPDSPVHERNDDELHRADQALATDLDMLLQGDFDTIDAVLDGVFEERAILVQAGEHARAQSPTSISDSALASTPTVALAPPPVSAASMLPIVETAISSVADNAQGWAGEQPSSPPLKSLEVSSVHINVASTPSQSVLQSSPAIMVQGLDAKRRTIRIQVDIAAWKHRVANMIHGVLVLASAPLRLVPTRLRTATDIVAISLVLWIPLSFLLPPRIAAWKETRAAAAFTTSQVHSESSHAAKTTAQTADAEHDAPATSVH